MSFLNRVKLQTPESVELDFLLAGVGNRAYALLIDYVILSVVGVGYQIALVVVTTLLPDLVGGLTDSLEDLRNWLLALLLLSYFFIYIGYFVFFEVLWQGQTPGKRWVKIRVISDNGRPVKLQQAALRALLRPIDDILFLGVFFIFLGKREKRIGDWVAGTLVIQEEESIASISVSPEAQPLADRLRVEADLSSLSPEDFAVIREYLHRRKEMIPEARRNVSQKLASRVKNMIALEQVPQITANLFLEAVYLAYQQPSDLN